MLSPLSKKLKRNCIIVLKFKIRWSVFIIILIIIIIITTRNMSSMRVYDRNHVVL